MASTIATYVLDVSAPMAEMVPDEETGRNLSKIDLCKEYVARKIAPKVSLAAVEQCSNERWHADPSLQIQSGRKTEHAGLVTFGGVTNNPYFAKDASSRPEAEAYDPADFLGVGSVFPPQQARPSMLSELKALEVGKGNANRKLLLSSRILN